MAADFQLSTPGALSATDVKRAVCLPTFVDPLGLIDDFSTSKLADDISGMPDEEPILQGFLRKEGTSRDSWKRRWFVLRKDRLEYLKRQDSEETQGAIDIATITGITADTDAYSQPHSFQLLTASGRVYALQAPLEAAQRHWLSAIAAVIYRWHQINGDLSLANDFTAEGALALSPVPGLGSPAGEGTSLSSSFRDSSPRQGGSAPSASQPAPAANGETGASVSIPDALSMLDKLSAALAAKKATAAARGRKPHKQQLQQDEEAEASYQRHTSSSAQHVSPKRSRSPQKGRVLSINGPSSPHRQPPPQQQQQQALKVSRIPVAAASASAQPASMGPTLSASLSGVASSKQASAAASASSPKRPAAVSTTAGKTVATTARKRCPAPSPSSSSSALPSPGPASYEVGEASLLAGHPGFLSGDFDSILTMLDAEANAAQARLNGTASGGAPASGSGAVDAVPLSLPEQDIKQRDDTTSGSRGRGSPQLAGRGRMLLEELQAADNAAAAAAHQQQPSASAAISGGGDRPRFGSSSRVSFAGSAYNNDVSDGTSPKKPPPMPAAGAARANSANGTTAGGAGGGDRGRKSLGASGISSNRARSKSRGGTFGSAARGSGLDVSKAALASSSVSSSSASSGGAARAGGRPSISRLSRSTSASAAAGGGGGDRGRDSRVSTTSASGGPAAFRESAVSRGSTASDDGENDATVPPALPIASPPPLPSQHRLEYAKRWINSLAVPGFPPLPLDKGSKLGPSFNNGVLLCGILQALEPGLKLDGLNPKPRAAAACLANIELALRALGRAQGLRRVRIPTAEEIYGGKEERIQGLLTEMLEAYALRKARAGAQATLAWLGGLVDAYDVSASIRSVASARASGGASWRGLWRDLRDGTLLALLAHYHGGDAGLVGPKHGVALSAISVAPAVASQRQANIRASVPVLAELGARFVVNETLLAVAVEPDGKKDFDADEDDDAALLQLRMLSDCLAPIPCALPELGDIGSSPLEAQSEAARSGTVGLATVSAVSGAGDAFDPAGGANDVRSIVVGAQFADYEPWQRRLPTPPPPPPPPAAAPVQPSVSSPVRSRTSSSASLGQTDDATSNAAPLPPPRSPSPSLSRHQSFLGSSSASQSALSSSGALLSAPLSAGEISRERDRLFALARNRVEPERRESAAVSAVALRWANTKAAAWAAERGGNEQLIAMALAAEPPFMPPPAQPPTADTPVMEPVAEAPLPSVPSRLPSPAVSPIAQRQQQEEEENEVEVERDEKEALRPASGRFTVTPPPPPSAQEEADAAAQQRQRPQVVRHRSPPPPMQPTAAATQTSPLRQPADVSPVKSSTSPAVRRSPTRPPPPKPQSVVGWSGEAPAQSLQHPSRQPQLVSPASTVSSPAGPVEPQLSPVTSPLQQQMGQSLPRPAASASGSTASPPLARPLSYSNSNSISSTSGSPGQASVSGSTAQQHRSPVASPTSPLMSSRSLSPIPPIPLASSSSPPAAAPAAPASQQQVVVSASLPPAVAAMTFEPLPSPEEMRRTMAREEMRSWELARQRAIDSGLQPQLPLRGAPLFAISAQTQPLMVQGGVDTEAELSGVTPSSAAPARSRVRPLAASSMRRASIAESVASSVASMEAAHPPLPATQQAQQSTQPLQRAQSFAQQQPPPPAVPAPAPAPAPRGPALGPGQRLFALRLRGHTQLMGFRVEKGTDVTVSWVAPGAPAGTKPEGSVQIGHLSGVSVKGDTTGGTGLPLLTLRIAGPHVAKLGGIPAIEILPPDDSDGAKKALKAFGSELSGLHATAQMTALSMGPVVAPIAAAGGSSSTGSGDTSNNSSAGPFGTLGRTLSAGSMAAPAGPSPFGPHQAQQQQQQLLPFPALSGSSSRQLAAAPAPGATAAPRMQQQTPAIPFPLAATPQLAAARPLSSSSPPKAIASAPTSPTGVGPGGLAGLPFIPPPPMPAKKLTAKAGAVAPVQTAKPPAAAAAVAPPPPPSSVPTPSFSSLASLSRPGTAGSVGVPAAPLPLLAAAAMPSANHDALRQAMAARGLSLPAAAGASALAQLRGGAGGAHGGASASGGGYI